MFREAGRRTRVGEWLACLALMLSSPLLVAPLVNLAASSLLLAP